MLAPGTPGSQAIEAGVEHGSGMNDKVECGHATKKLMNTRRDHTAWTGHTLHLSDYRLNFRDDVQGQR